MCELGLTSKSQTTWHHRNKKLDFVVLIWEAGIHILALWFFISAAFVSELCKLKKKVMPMFAYVILSKNIIPLFAVERNSILGN